MNFNSVQKMILACTVIFLSSISASFALPTKQQIIKKLTPSKPLLHITTEKTETLESAIVNAAIQDALQHGCGFLGKQTKISNFCDSYPDIQKLVTTLQKNSKTATIFAVSSTQPAFVSTSIGYMQLKENNNAEEQLKSYLSAHKDIKPDFLIFNIHLNNQSQETINQSCQKVLKYAQRHSIPLLIAFECEQEDKIPLMTNSYNYLLQQQFSLNAKVINKLYQIKNWAYKNPKKAIAGAVAALGASKYLAYKAQRLYRQNRYANNTQPKFPIVYHDDYNMGIAGFTYNPYGFDLHKSEKVFNNLMNSLKLSRYQTHQPEPIGDETLELVHTKKFLANLHDGNYVRQEIFGNQNGMQLPGVVPLAALDYALLNPMKLQVSGTVQAAKLAMEHGFSFNLGGGFHHAKAGGADENGMIANCIYADINLAIATLRQEKPDLKVLVVDLDAHQGNGYATIKGETNDENLFIFDIYNLDRDFGPRYNGAFFDSLGIEHRCIGGGDLHSKQFINYHFPVRSKTAGKEYLQLLQEQLPQAIEECKPDIIIYNAGTDILQGDRVGGINDITPQNIIDRDAFVFAQGKENKIPVCMLFSGGYTAKTSKIIADSITNIVQTHFKDDLEKIQA